MSHYVCPNCQGTSGVPKVCETEDCKNKGNDLAECSCVNGQHTEVGKDANPNPEIG